MTYTAKQLFGISGDELARQDTHDPQTSRSRTMTAAPAATLEPPQNAARALTDPQGSAIFWIAAAAALGLVLVTGQFKVAAAVGGRAGRR